MRKFYCILVTSVMLVISALSAFGQVGQVNKPKQPTKPATTKVKKTAGNNGSKTNKLTRHASSTRTDSKPRYTVNNGTTSTSSNSSSVVSVTINCNAEAADVYIDNSYLGVSGTSHNLKTGPHTIQLVADGYEEFLDNFNVTATNRSFNFTMTKKMLQSVLDLVDEMIFVHGGAFTMGSKGLDAEYDEKPAHEVILPSYYISKYEVTQQLWMDVMGGNPSIHIGDMIPVHSVSWDDCQLFISRLNAISGIKFRLPTEAEWEYAARGGRKMAMYPWGGNYARDAKGCFLANFKPYRGAYSDDTGVMTMRVAQFQPNDFGLFDMAGNVAEWTSSAFNPAANTYVSDINPDFQYMARKEDPDVLKRKIVKGGSWKDISAYMQCGARTYEYQYESRTYIGFRCVRSFIGD